MTDIHHMRLRALELAAAQEERCFSGEPIEKIAQRFLDFIAPLPVDDQNPGYDPEAAAALMRSLPAMWTKGLRDAIARLFPDIDESSASWLIARLVDGVVECRKNAALRGEE